MGKHDLSYLSAMSEPQLLGQKADDKLSKNYTRVVINNWTAGAVSQPIQLPRPAVAVCLGPKDESGGVILRGPSFAEDDGAIGVNAPFLGTMEGAITLVSSYPNAYSNNYGFKLDLIFYHAYPPSFPVRSTLFKSQAAVAGSSNYFPTFGRKRTRVLIDTPSASAHLQIFGIMATVGANPSGILAADAAATTVAFPYEFGSGQTSPSAVGSYAAGALVPSSPDWVLVQVLGGPNANVTVAAWDY